MKDLRKQTYEELQTNLKYYERKYCMGKTVVEMNNAKLATI